MALTKEIDYLYSLEFLIFFSTALLISEIIVFGIWWKSKKKISELSSTSVGGNAFKNAQLFVFITGLGGLFGYSWRIYSNNQSAIFTGTNNIFIPLGLGLFIIYLTIYMREVINLSKTMKRYFRILMVVSLFCTFFTSGVIALNMIFTFEEKLVALLFASLAIIFAGALITDAAVALHDIIRISNRLTKVRLIFTTIASSLIFMQILSVGIYFLITLQTGDMRNLLPLAAIFCYWESIPASLALYFSYFIPERIQIATGILPPSFKLLKEKQKRLANKKATGRTQ